MLLNITCNPNNSYPNLLDLTSSEKKNQKEKPCELSKLKFEICFDIHGFFKRKGLITKIIK